MESHTTPLNLEEVPIIDMQAYFEKQPGQWELECKKVADSLHKFGILIVRDPRVNHKDNDEYIDMIENYFEKTGGAYYRGEELLDCRPELSYQTGVTPEAIEKARDHAKLVETLPDEQKPMSRFPPEYDAKWRFFWPIGDRPSEIRNDLPKVIPDGFDQWEAKMDKWGNFMIGAAESAAEMAAVGMGIDKDTFTSKMKQGSHLLAPTASDLSKYEIGTAFAGFHYDLNFLTVHGKSRYPGLFIWLRDWTRMACKVPQGCLLMQAGAMFEYCTGGHVLAGFHEVVYTQATKDVYENNKKHMAETGDHKSLWRISSTLFSHLRYNVDISPLPELAHLYDAEEVREKYPKMTAHEKLCEELKAVNLAPK